jgi:hypothetical protein
MYVTVIHGQRGSEGGDGGEQLSHIFSEIRSHAAITKVGECI